MVSTCQPTQYTVKFRDLSKTLQVGCDVRGYIGADGRRCIMNFRRAFPPEHPKCTHSYQSLGSVGHVEIFAASTSQTKPKSFKPRRIIIVYSTWQMRTNTIETLKQLPEGYRRANSDYASDLSRRSKEHIGKMDVTFEMHRLGMNLRHLGLLRGHFWFRLPGLVSLDFNSRYIKTTNDTTGDIDIGSKILVQVPHSAEHESKGETAHQRKQRLKMAARKAANEHKQLVDNQDSKSRAQHAAGDNSQLVQHGVGTNEQVLSLAPDLEDLDDLREEDEDLEEKTQLRTLRSSMNFQ